MAQISFPSETFPAFPEVSFDAPDDWAPRAAANTVLAVVNDRGAEAFSPNVVVGITRFPGEQTLDQAEASVEAYVAGLPDVAIVDTARVAFGGRSWAVSEFAYSTEQVGTVMQVVAVGVVSSGAVTDVVRITGTATPADYEESLPVIRKIVASTRLS